MEKIEIELSKNKIALLTIGSLIFVVLSILFLLNPESFTSFRYRNENFIRIAGILSTIFFGATGIYGCFKFFDKKVGLTLNNIGLIDNTNASSVGNINWDEISEIKMEQVMSTKFLLVYVKNPNKFIENSTGFKKKIMIANNKMYGTPISITSNTLKCNFDELEKIVLEFYNFYKK